MEHVTEIRSKYLPDPSKVNSKRYIKVNSFACGPSEVAVVVRKAIFPAFIPVFFQQLAVSAITAGSAWIAFSRR